MAAGVNPLTNLPGITGSSSVKSAQRILATNYPGFQLQIPDQIRTDIFLNNFKTWSPDNATCNMPNLVAMSVPADHTNGISTGYPVPQSMVADNDLAIGRLIDTVSHSACWASSAIFVTEDDSQDGVDHVDGRQHSLLQSRHGSDHRIAA